MTNPTHQPVFSLVRAPLVPGSRQSQFDPIGSLTAPHVPIELTLLLTRVSGGDWNRLDYRKLRWRAVVDQLATLKADQILTADKSFALAA